MEEQEQEEKLAPVRKRVMDSREPGSIRMALYQLGWEQSQMLNGDYWFFTHDYKKIGIERKTVEDLVNSLGDRLSRQLEGSLDHYHAVILLIEGSWQKVREQIVISRGLTNYTWDTVWNYLRRWQDRGVTIELTIDEGHTVHRLNNIYALYQKAYSLTGLSKEITDDRVLAFPSGSRGKTGLEVLKYFGTLENVAHAFPDDLMTVEGIGEKKANAIYDHFHKGEIVRRPIDVGDTSRGQSSAESGNRNSNQQLSYWPTKE